MTQTLLQLAETMKHHVPVGYHQGRRFGKQVNERLTCWTEIGEYEFDERCPRCKVERWAREKAKEWIAERAHTHSSENAGHYRGFEAGRLASARELVGDER